MLYPAIKPYATHQLAVDATHTLYIEESGNPKGLPVVYTHGGPGVGTYPEHRQFFDPNLYRIVLFDQRGAGQSTPHAQLEGNTTLSLVSDMEIIRDHLCIDRWVLFGGSWGSTLALIYAETYPEQVLSMVLNGIFLARQEDFAWLYESGGASRLFPDHWEAFIGHLPIEERSAILQNYYQRLISGDEATRMATSKAWAEWEGSFISLRPNPQIIHRLESSHTAISLARIEAHYFVNQAFLEPNQILNNAHRLKNIPGVIVHGRYDVVCPLDNAYALNKVWSQSELHIIPDAGHAAYEPGTINALITATNMIAKRHNSLPFSN